MAIKTLLKVNDFKPSVITCKTELAARFESQECVTIATGVTCSFLGDERNIREFLVASEAAALLRDKGHVVNHLLFDDNLDPLNERQLRVAVNKSQSKIEEFRPLCGRPVSNLPSPDGSDSTWSGHFEKLLMRRLSEFECYPQLISVDKLYKGGIYDRYVRIVLERRKDIERFIQKAFPNYNPQALFHPICPACGSIAGTHLDSYNSRECVISCSACEMIGAIPAHALEGKLNWKLDCAARWHYFRIDLEPFSKAYLDPNAGAYEVARAIGNAFFGGVRATPLLIGNVKVDPELSSTALNAVPRDLLRHLMTEKWSTDISLSKQRIKSAASKKLGEAHTPITDFVKQEVPKLAVRKAELTGPDVVKLEQAEAFADAFLDHPKDQTVPNFEILALASTKHLKAIAELTQAAVSHREKGSEYATFDVAVKQTADACGVPFKEAGALFRELLGQHRGLPIRRLLFTATLVNLQLINVAVSSLLESRIAKAELARHLQDSALLMGRQSVRIDTDSVVVLG